MSEYYRAVFSIAKADLRGVRLLESVRDAAREWIGADFGASRPAKGEPNKRVGDAGEMSESERVRAEDGLATFRILWERQTPDGSGERWRLSARFATEGDDVEADIEIFGIENRQAELGAPYLAALPSVPARLLAEFDCRLDGRRMTGAAARIEGADAAKAFVSDWLYAPERRTPIVAATPSESGAGVDADALQENLLGLATVVECDRDAAARAARYAPPALRCVGGDVRVYSPGCSGYDVAPQNPRLSLEDALRLQDAGRLWLVLRDECVNRISRRARRRLYANVRARIQNAEREADFQALVELERESQSNQSGGTDIDPEFYEAYMSLEDEYGEPPRGSAATYKRIAVVSQRRNKNLEAENKELGREMENLKSRVCESGDGGDGPPAPTADAELKSVLEAVTKAGDAFDTLVLFQTAFEYARDSQFRPAVKVYDAFAVLNDCAKARAKGGLGKDLAQWLAERGVEYARRESGATDENEAFRKVRTFCGVYMPAHVKMGGGDLRIHLRWEEAESRWLIGYVGKHLPTANFPD